MQILNIVASKTNPKKEYVQLTPQEESRFLLAWKYEGKKRALRSTCLGKIQAVNPEVKTVDYAIQNRAIFFMSAPEICGYLDEVDTEAAKLKTEKNNRIAAA